MSSQPDYVREAFGPLRDKTLQNVLAHRIAHEFPRIGGPRLQQCCAALILEVLEQHLRPREHLHHGQILWLAVPLDRPPRRHQKIADTELTPVVLDLCTAEDIDRRLDRQRPSEYRLQKCLRLCRQAHQQGGLLSNCDLAELLATNDSHVAQLLVAHERAVGAIVPRRANLHDVGSGVTHKRLICRKPYLEGKEPHQVAQETYHSLEAVDRYLGQYDRVRHCRLQGLSPQETAFALHCTVRLVQEYLHIDQELEEQKS